MSLVQNIQSKTKVNSKGRVLFHKDPMPVLSEKGLAVQVGNGLFVLSGELTRILEKIDLEIIKIARKVNAESAHVPCMLSWENTEKSSYLHSFSNQALVIDPFLKGDKNSHFCLASPTVCYHYFSSLSGRNVNKNQVITALSRCSRKESGNLNNLGRLTNFTMREIVFLGDEDYCLKLRQKILKETLKMLNKVFDLKYEVITASDPFFGEGSELKKRAQVLMESKYEIQAAIPFNKSTVSIASFNMHGNVFYGRFGIESPDVSLNCSGCVGWGYERILYSILTQKGIDFSLPYYKKLLNK